MPKVAAGLPLHVEACAQSHCLLKKAGAKLPPEALPPALGRMLSCEMNSADAQLPDGLLGRKMIDPAWLHAVLCMLCSGVLPGL